MSVSPLESPLLRAVIVDDTPDIRLLLRFTLERDGDIEVVAEAGDGLAGVEAVGDSQPDVVLLDLAMPVMDGLEALPMMRRVCPDARIVVLSGFEAEAMAERALHAGADGYLQKGVSPASILAYVRRVATGSERPATRPSPDAVATVRELVTEEPAQQPAGDGPARNAARRAAELAPCALVLVEGDRGRVAYLNDRAAELFEVTLDPVGRDISDVSPVLGHLVEHRRPALRAGGELRERVVVGGEQVQVVLRPVGDDLVIAVHPVPESDEAERLRRAIATAAHEIRNPVTVLSGVAQAIQFRKDSLTPAQRDDLLGALLRQAALLERLTEDLLTAGQAHRGALRVETQPVPLAPLLADAVADLAQPFPVLGAEGVRVLADPTRLGQMVSNLLTNAVKYGAPPFAVRVRRIVGRPEVHIIVEDSGPGVPEAFRDQLFEEFSRAPDAGSRGAGLGLFVVRSLAQAQGGWADYAPRAGGGSAFTIVLPDAQGLRPVPGETPGQSGRPDSA